MLNVTLNYATTIFSTPLQYHHTISLCKPILSDSVFEHTKDKQIKYNKESH